MEAKPNQHNTWAGLYGMVIVVLAFVMSMTTCLTAQGPKDALFHLSYHIILYIIGFVVFAYLYVDVIWPFAKNIKQSSCKPESGEYKDGTLERIAGSERKTRQGTSESAECNDHDRCESGVDILTSPRVFYEENGVHFYLRIGLLMFGVGSMIQDGFKLSILFDVKYDCLATLFVPTAAMRMLYVFIQTWFLFKYHRLVVNTKKLVVRFCYAHLMGTSIGMWLWVVMEESVRQMQIHLAPSGPGAGDGPSTHDSVESHGSGSGEYGLPSHTQEVHDVHRRAAPDISSNDTQPILGQILTTVAHGVMYPGSHDYHNTGGYPDDINGHTDVPGLPESGQPLGAPAGSSCRVPDSLAWTAAPFLTPCFVEFGLISFAIFYRLYRHIGVNTKTVPIVISEANVGGRTINAGVTHCHKANNGLFLGCFVILAMIVGLAVYFIHLPDFTYGKMDGHIYFFRIVEDVIIICSFASVIVSFIGMRDLRVLEASERENEVNGALVMVTYLGLILYDAFKIVSCINYLVKTEYKTFVSHALVNASLSAIQGTAQSLFILGALRRRAASLEHVRNKPGRNAVSFLLACNLALWISIIFETKKYDTHMLYEEFFSYLAWTVITFVCVPLNILYRFHSTVCLAEIWGSAYSLKEKTV